MISRSTDISIVAAQLSAWALLIALADLQRLVATVSLLVTAVLGVIVAASAAFQLGTRSYTASTRPRASNVFTDRGVYRYLRHPIYTGLFIASLALFLSRPTPVVGIAYLLVILVTNARVGLEESMLEERYPQYVEYRDRTRRYLPFLI